MNTGILTIRTIFGQQRRHLVPLFQRPYVWGQRDQWEPLWNDLRSLAERLLRGQETRSHFLGAIVLDQVQMPTGYIESRWVIDGQQRLTTMQVVLEAFSDLCQQYGVKQKGSALLALTRNANPMEESPDVEFKVWPTNSDREVFRSVMRAGSAGEVRAGLDLAISTRKVGHPIGDAYLYFHDTIGEWLRPGDEGFDARLDALFRAIPDFVRMVVIDLGPEDDAQLIFETLNARGTPLLPIDLVKNFLFHRAELRKLALDPLYDAHWRAFDEDARYWREEFGTGHNVRARIDAFLQNYLTLKRKDEVGKAHLYSAYCELVDGNGGDPVHHMAELSGYAKVYRRLDARDAESRSGLFLDRLEALDIGAAHPFLLELFSRFGASRKELDATLARIESFLVRRMVCQLNTRGYNRLFIDLLPTLEGPADGLGERVASQLAGPDADSNRWPRDAEFKTAWRNQPMFRSLKRQRVRMLLLALERQLHDDKNEAPKLSKKLTVEHLLPQSWQGPHWPLPGLGDETAESEERERLIHTIGNLTLLTQKLNSALSNGKFESKRKAILKHSALNLNRPLAEWDGWDEGAIQKRSDELFKAARKIWPAPAEG